MRGLVLALAFLTRLPARARAPVADRELAAATVWYPLAGAVVGLTAAAAWTAAGLVLPGALAAAMAVAAGTAVTGGLHLDGLMDSADGLFSGRDRERMLAIMRDSRVGAMGAIALSLDLLLRYSTVQALGAGPHAALALVLAAAFARLPPVLAMGRYPYARAGDGLGRSYLERVGPAQRWGAALLAAALGLAATLGLAVAGAESPLWAPAAALAAAVAAGAAATRYMAARLGGLTGDTLGALVEVAEVSALVVFAAAGGRVGR